MNAPWNRVGNIIVIAYFFDQRKSSQSCAISLSLPWTLSKRMKSKNGEKIEGESRMAYQRY